MSQPGIFQYYTYSQSTGGIVRRFLVVIEYIYQ